MSTKLGKYLLVLLILSQLVACAQLSQLETQNAIDKEIVQNAKTYSDHNKLANRYDTVAKEMVAKAKEKKESLEEYNEHSHYYGRQGQDFKSHTVANIRYYEQAAHEATKQADYHRTIAAELLKQEYAKPAETPDQQVNRKAKLNSDSGDMVESSIKTQ
ncbi:hypothetical protein [Nitrosomonas sp. Nm166]|uniref:hypothetical protein n=1 Tax=Nitrosomonas sp. Nm166 TaxID=1881054 RepID=UPI000B870CE8|nr:hypothetical protein [Nitrosomonas sp. Nm166]